jgi:hypothetical protein
LKLNALITQRIKKSVFKHNYQTWNTIQKIWGWIGP